MRARTLSNTIKGLLDDPNLLRRCPAPGRSDDLLLGRLTQQLAKDQFPVLLENVKASFEGIKQRLRHL
jgi:hypothetical protein